MKLTPLSTLLLVFTATSFAQLPEKPEDISPLLIGEKIPDITLETVDGKLILHTFRLQFG